MKHLLRFVAAATMLAAAESTALTWRAPKATLAAMDVFFGAQEAPQPTAAPAGPLLAKRQTNREQTCGFLGGALDDPVACPNGASCVVNTVSSLVGCCASGECQVPATCLPLESSAQGARADTSQTLYCSASAAPACATLVYLDPNHLGVSGFFCDAAPTQYAVYYSAFAASSTPTAVATTAKAPTTARTGTAAPTDTSAAGSTNNNNGGGGGGGSSTPVGAIVGGVVGGVAVLALLAIALFFLLRRSRKPRYVPAPQAPGAHDPFSRGPPVTQMAAAAPHHHYLAAGGYGDAKPSYDGSSSGGGGGATAASSLAPSLVLRGMRSAPHSPPPPEGYDATVPYGPDYVGVGAPAPYSDVPAAAELGGAGRERPVSELPVERGHGEVRELA